MPENSVQQIFGHVSSVLEAGLTRRRGAKVTEHELKLDGLGPTTHGLCHLAIPSALCLSVLACKMGTVLESTSKVLVSSENNALYPVIITITILTSQG